MSLQGPPHVIRRYERRNTKLRSLGFAKYGDYLRSQHWAKTKKAYRESDLPQACICGEEEVQLHHMTYERVGAEPLTDLTPLCPSCHALVHALDWRGDGDLTIDGLLDKGRALEGRDLLRKLAEDQRRALKQKAADERAHVLSLSFAARLLRARDASKARHIDASHELHVIVSMVKNGASDRALTNRLRHLEARAYNWPDWDSLPAQAA